MHRLPSFLAAILVSGFLAGCGSAAPATPAGPAPTLTGSSPRIVARDMKFVTTTAAAPANTAFAMDFDNQDSVPHNVSIASSSGQDLFRGEVFTGSSHRVYAVPPLAAGAYSFKCDVHPDMKGTLTVS